MKIARTLMTVFSALFSTISLFSVYRIFSHAVAPPAPTALTLQPLDYAIRLAVGVMFFFGIRSFSIKRSRREKFLLFYLIISFVLMAVSISMEMRVKRQFAKSSHRGSGITH